MAEAPLIPPPESDPSVTIRDYGAWSVEIAYAAVVLFVLALLWWFNP